MGGGPGAAGNVLADQPGKALGFISIFWAMGGMSVWESHLRKI